MAAQEPACADPAKLVKLAAHPVEKPWGRSDLPPGFRVAEGGERIGELWYRPADDRPLPLLVKWLFTSERLSIQVHPDDAQARARGLPQGKSECWYVTAAEPGATLGLGTREPLAPDRLRALALDGGIEAMMDWKPVQAGDFFVIPAGTVHAIGSGITLIEIQQNSDVTYRLYDYGRARELHLEDGVAVAKAEPYDARLAVRAEERREGEAARVLARTRHFTVVRGNDPDAVMASLQGQVWIVPVAGEASGGGTAAGPGECLLLEPGQHPVFAPGTLVIAACAAA